jgi:hypothetical protein
VRQGGETDEDISPLHTMQGPITGARARQLDLQVYSNLVNYFSELTLGSMHVLLIRNNGEDRRRLGEGQGISFHGEVVHVPRVITNGVVV